MLSRTLRSSTASFRVANRTIRRRCLATSSQTSSSSSDNNASTSTSSAQLHSQSPSQDRPLTPAEHAFLDKAIRVDQAGELAANYIYAGQAFVLGRDPQVGSVIKQMWDQEVHHLNTMNALQHTHSTRPTILWEVAKVAGWGLGAATALMGREAAMACTEAVETEIGEHYNDQLREIAHLASTSPPSSGPSPTLASFADTITKFRDDELEHLDTAIEYHSQRAPAHALLSAVVGLGCKVAIELCERI